ncbi:MAG: tetraacyldisaccharide 4'-kinase [Planctomycetota bacterium]
MTVGGTGKTPVVEYLAKRCANAIPRVAILSRGYGSEDGPNDEALLLEQNLPDVPHLQSRDRVAIAEIAVQELESEILLDDGFQHRLQRDWDVVLLDATDPWGGGEQLPAGLCRKESASSIGVLTSSC